MPDGGVPLRARSTPLLVHGGQRPPAGRASRDRGGDGLDLVKLQLHIAAGGRLEGDPPTPNGHAIEARLNAEDPALGFAPAPGRLILLRLPTGPGLRVDTGVAEGDVIPAEFDSMIGKLIAWGRDRDEAFARLRRAIADTVVVVDGGTTNQGFLLELLDARGPRRRGRHVLLDRLYVSGGAMPVRHGDIALLQAAIELADRDAADDRARFYAFARRGRPQAAGSASRTYELRHRGQSYRLAVAQIAPDDTGSRSRAGGRAARPAARAARAAARAARPGYRTLTSSRATTCSSRSTACRTGSRAMTAASSGIRPGARRLDSRVHG